MERTSITLDRLKDYFAPPLLNNPEGLQGFARIGKFFKDLKSNLNALVSRITHFLFDGQWEWINNNTVLSKINAEIINLKQGSKAAIVADKVEEITDVSLHLNLYKIPSARYKDSSDSEKIFQFSDRSEELSIKGFINTKTDPESEFKPQLSIEPDRTSSDQLKKEDTIASEPQPPAEQLHDTDTTPDQYTNDDATETSEPETESTTEDPSKQGILSDQLTKENAAAFEPISQHYIEQPPEENILFEQSTKQDPLTFEPELKPFIDNSCLSDSTPILQPKASEELKDTILYMIDTLEPQERVANKVSDIVQNMPFVPYENLEDQVNEVVYSEVQPHSVSVSRALSHVKKLDRGQMHSIECDEMISTSEKVFLVATISIILGLAVRGLPNVPVPENFLSEGFRNTHILVDRYWNQLFYS